MDNLRNKPYFNMEAYTEHKGRFAQLDDNTLNMFALSVILETQLQGGSVSFELRTALVDVFKDRLTQKLKGLDKPTQLESNT